MTTLLRRTGVLTATSLLLVAGCGSGGSSSGSGDGSSDGSSGGSSASPSASGGSGAALSKANFATRLRDAQKKAGTLHFTISTKSAGQILDGKGESRFDPPEADVTLNVAGQTVETIVKDGSYYIKGLPSAKPWLKLDPKATSGLGARLGQLQSSSDPSSSLNAFGAASKVEKSGETKVGGVDTTRYTVTITGAALGKALKYPVQIVSQLPKTIEYVVYVDGKDLTRRLTSSFAVSGQTISSDIVFSGYGDPVSVSAPPAAQTTTKEPKLG